MNLPFMGSDCEDTEEDNNSLDNKKTEVTERRQLDVYEVTFHYDNGDVETEKVYSQANKKDDNIIYQVDPDPQIRRRRGESRVKVYYTNITRNYYTLSREPIIVEKDPEILVLEYEEFNGNPIKGTLSYHIEQNVCDWEDDIDKE